MRTKVDLISHDFQLRIKIPATSPAFLVTLPSLPKGETPGIPEEPDSPIVLLLASFPKLAIAVNVLDDEVADDALPEPVVLRQAEEKCPAQSLVHPQPGTTSRTAFSQSAQHGFKVELSEIDPRIVAHLEQPFGKDNLTQFFISEPALCHVLLPLWKSGFFAGHLDDWDSPLSGPL